MTSAGLAGPARHLDLQAGRTVDITEVLAWSGKLARDPAPPVQAPALAVQVALAPAPAVQVARAPARAVPAQDAERE